MNGAEANVERHRHYLYEMVRLKLWFLWRWLRDHPDEDFVRALRERVDIFRKTDINGGGLDPREPAFGDPRWLDVERRAARLFERTRNDATADQFEADGFEIFRPSVDARCLRDYRGWVGPCACRFGSLTYHELDPNHPGAIPFHIANAVRPRSIFDDRSYLPRCLMEMMDAAEAEYGAERLFTFTWLNSHPRWLELFPEEWRADRGPENRNVQWHFGWWGQFINARGQLNAKLAQALRDTGEFPYWPRHAECSFASLRAHLTMYLEQTGRSDQPAEKGTAR